MPKKPVENTETGETSENSEAAASTSSTITIQGHSFAIPHRYAEGHILNGHEASAMNQLRAENLRNNFSNTIAKLRESLALDKEAPLPDEHHADIAQKFAEYEGQYSLAAKRTGGVRTPVDPVEREATKIAESIVRDGLSKRGYDLKTVTKEKLRELAQTLMARRPDIKEQAKRRVEETKALADSVLSDEDLAMVGDDPGEAVEEQAAA